MMKCSLLVLAMAATAMPMSAAWAQAPAAAKAPAAAAKAPASISKQKAFGSPEDAVKALVDAVRAADANALLAVVGPASKSWIFTGDTVSDRADWAKFLEAYDKKNAIVKEGDAKAVLEVGADGWPFPAPLVKKGNQWTFDAEAGREEVTNRRVGGNELSAIQTMYAIVDAQRAYAAADPNRDGIASYASKFISSPGKKDGLYWEAKGSEPESPLGPLIGAATAQGYAMKKGEDAKPQAYHGYYFRILSGQGKAAKGGAYDYRVKGRLFGGFAVAAYPASYGVSGVKTFIVNHDGVVYEKDLGAATATAAKAMTLFNPDKSWQKAE
jgi:Protein of unknown function (DUF2950)